MRHKKNTLLLSYLIVILGMCFLAFPKTEVMAEGGQIRVNGSITFEDEDIIDVDGPGKTEPVIKEPDEPGLVSPKKPEVIGAVGNKPTSRMLPQTDEDAFTSIVQKIVGSLLIIGWMIFIGRRKEGESM